jgi:hypothetical protein
MLKFIVAGLKWLPDLVNINQLEAEICISYQI